MDKNQKQPESSRRQFLTKLLGNQTEKIKLLTPDGKLVEVDKTIVEAAAKSKKATNKDIYDWMQNPSKKNS